MNGIEIHFPFKPYDVQRDYMAGVVAALRDATNALLESPTGTGKTLAYALPMLQRLHLM